MTLRLEPRPGAPAIPGPVVIVVMDGIGLGRSDEGNAVHLARKPNLDALIARGPFLPLRAHGTAVGMPSDDDMGNSEVGHNAIGAGRVFDQGAKRVRAGLASGDLFRGETWRAIVDRVRQNGQPLHFLGLLSDGNVHSHEGHLYAMLRRADEEGVTRVRVHALLDGRDVPETSALTYVDRLEAVLASIRVRSDRDYAVASGGGRMTTTMDRYGADWTMVERGWKHHVLGLGRRFASLRQAVETLREENPGITDQNLPPFVIADEAGPRGPIQDGAAVILFNFRGDRAIEISRAFEEATFTAFARGARPDVLFAGMMEYDGDLHIPRRFLLPPPAIDRTLGEYLVGSGISQFAISETQKFGHVTYFWNGNRSGKFDDALETYMEIPSDRAPFEERPWMKAAEITDALIAALKTGKYRHARVNYANGDMVGHTGARESAILAVEVVDLMIGRLIPVVRALSGALVITADHGNADEMWEWDKKSRAFSLDAAGQPRPKTSHTLNAVPFVIDAPIPLSVRSEVPRPGLANIASTLIELLGFRPPEDYEPSVITF